MIGYQGYAGSTGSQGAYGAQGIAGAQGAAGGPFADGSAVAPSITFNSDLNTGIFHPSSDEIGFTSGGQEQARIAPNGLSVNDGIRRTGTSHDWEDGYFGSSDYITLTPSDFSASDINGSLLSSVSVTTLANGPFIASAPNFTVEKEASDTVNVIATVVIPKGFKLDDSRDLLIFEHSDATANNVDGVWELLLGDLTSNSVSYIAGGTLQGSDQQEEDSFSSSVAVIGDGSKFIVIRLRSFGSQTWELNNGGIIGVKIPIARH